MPKYIPPKPSIWARIGAAIADMLDSCIDLVVAACAVVILCYLCATM